MTAAVGDGDGGGNGSLPLFSSIVVHRVPRERFVFGSRRWFGAQDSDSYPHCRLERKKEAEEGRVRQERGRDRAGG